MSLELELGRPMTTKQVAEYFGVDPRTVRKYRTELGGVYLLGQLTFFDKRIQECVYAMQNQETWERRMARRSDETRSAQTEDFLLESRRSRLGSRDAKELEAGPNRWGLLDSP